MMFRFLLRNKDVKVTTVDGLIISTVRFLLWSYQTAIIDRFMIYPVEVYKTLKKAQAGHENWCKKVIGMEEVDVLNLKREHNGIIMPLERFPEESLIEGEQKNAVSLDSRISISKTNRPDKKELLEIIVPLTDPNWWHKSIRNSHLYQKDSE